MITAYAITFGGFLMLGGRAADLLGRRRVFVVGVVVFTIASFFCGLAWSEGVLIASRAVQGLGAAIISPAALSIIMTTFDEGAERNKALGIWGAIGGGGAAVGVLAGGVLTKYLGWEWIFFVNVPVGAIALALTPRFVRESRADRESSPDILGAVTVTAGLALLVYAVSTAPSHHWGSATTLLLLAVSAALLVAFLVIESRAKDPLMPFHIFRIRTVAGANISALLLGASLFANFFLLTLYVQDVLGWSALKTGLTFIATAGSAVLWAGVAQALVTRFGAKPIMVIGFIGDARRHALVHADPGARLVLERPAAGLSDHRVRDSVRVHPGLDRRARRGSSTTRRGWRRASSTRPSRSAGRSASPSSPRCRSAAFDHLTKLHGASYFAQAFTSGTRRAFWACVVVSIVGLLAVAGARPARRAAHAREGEAVVLVRTRVGFAARWRASTRPFSTSSATRRSCDCRASRRTCRRRSSRSSST